MLEIRPIRWTVARVDDRATWPKENEQFLLYVDGASGRATIAYGVCTVNGKPCWDILGEMLPMRDGDIWAEMPKPPESILTGRRKKS